MNLGEGGYQRLLAERCAEQCLEHVGASNPLQVKLDRCRLSNYRMMGELLEREDLGPEARERGHTTLINLGRQLSAGDIHMVEIRLFGRKGCYSAKP